MKADIIYLRDSLLISKTNIPNIPRENISYSRAFETARLELQDLIRNLFEGKLYSTNHSGETPTYILAIEKLTNELKGKRKQLDSAIAKANDQR